MEGARGSGPLARLFGSLANTLLDVGLPRIQGWLRERLGDEADIGHVTMDGGFIHCDDVRLPIGPRGVLVLSRATVQVIGARGLGMPEMRLHAFEGELSFGAREERSFRADVRFRSAPEPSDAAWIAGELEIPRARWSGGEASPMEGSARLVVTSDAWHIEEGSLRGAEAGVKFRGEGSLEGGAGAADALRRASLVLESARVGPFFDAVQAIVGRAIEVPPGVPLDARITGELAWAGTGGTCTLHVAAEGLALDVVGSVAGDGTALAARVTGSIAPAAALRRAKVDAAFLPRDEDAIALEIDVTGEATKPIARGSLRAETLGFRFGRPRFQPVLVAKDVDVTIDGTADLVNVHLTARPGPGTIVIDAVVPTRSPEGRRVTARVTDLDASWLAAIACAAGAPVALEGEGSANATARFLPRDARAHGTVTLASGMEVRGSLGLTTPRTRLSVDPLIFEHGVLDGTRLAGEIAIADLVGTGIFTSEVRPAPDGTANLELSATGAPSAIALEGRISSPAIDLVIASRPEVPPFRIEAVEGAVAVTPEILRARDVRFRAYDGTCRADAALAIGRGTIDEPALIVHVQGASAALIEVLASLARGRMRVCVEKDGDRPPDEIWISKSMRVFGEARVAHDRSLHADLALETGAGTALVSSVTLSPAMALDGTTVKGTLAIVDILLAGAFSSTIHPLPDGALRIDANMKGAIDAVVLSGFATSERILLGFRGSPTAPVFAFTDVSTLLRFDGDRIVWHRLTAHAYGGVLTSAGLVGSLGHQSTLALHDVDAEHLPTDRAGARLGAEIRGKLSVELRFDQKGEHGIVTARGRATLANGAFPALRHVRAPLERYGLTPPPETAIAPATVDMDLGEHGWRFRNIALAVKGCAAIGEIWIRHAGELSGALVVTLGKEYLDSSAILVLPAVLTEKLILPVRLRGTLEKPLVDADLASCLGGFASDNRVSNFVSHAVDDVMGAIMGREVRRAPPAPPVAPPPAPPPKPYDEEAFMRELIAQGVDWDEIEERLDAYRRAHTKIRIG